MMAKRTKKAASPKLKGMPFKPTTPALPGMPGKPSRSPFAGARLKGKKKRG